MQRRNLLASIAAAAMILTGCASDPSTTASAAAASAAGGSGNALLGMLTSSLGVTQNQAEGGVGSILKLAQEKLVAGDFDKIAAVIPGSQKYLDTAKALGAFSGNIGNLAGLTSAFGKLGISPATASKFVPAVTDFVGRAGGSDVGALLKGAIS